MNVVLVHNVEGWIVQLTTCNTVSRQTGRGGSVVAVRHSRSVGFLGRHIMKMICIPAEMVPVPLLDVPKLPWDAEGSGWQGC